tara:strand:+ start:45 stop:668 length:624 start_codon:yes stop_codon:yes gene_type:complete
MAYYNFKYPFALSEVEPSLMGGITVPSQQTPTPTLPTLQPQQTPNPMGGGKNDKLSLMLYALGGALKGDKNFVQSTMQLQQMQEGKKKKKEKEENFQKFIKTIPKDSPFYDLAKTMGPENLDKLLLERYKAEQQQVDASKAIKQEELNVLNKLKLLNGKVDDLNNYEKLIYKNFIEKEDSQSILKQLGLIPNNTSNQPLEIEEIKKG